MKFFSPFLLLVLFFFSSSSIVNADITNAAFQIPANSAKWYVCSSNATGYVSYSLRVIRSLNSTAPPPVGTMLPSLPPDPTQKNISASVYTLVLTDANLKAYTGHGKFDYADTLSCIVKPVTKCDQDVGQDPLAPPTVECILVYNPTKVPVNVNITYSFDTTSVFGKSNFTSPDVPGGNSSVSTNSTSTGGSNSTSPNTNGGAANSNSTPSNQSSTGHVVKVLSWYMSAGAVIVGFLAISGLGF